MMGWVELACRACASETFVVLTPHAVCRERYASLEAERSNLYQTFEETVVGA